MAAVTRPPRVRLEPATLPFMLPTLVDTVPVGPGWLFELKWDGVRVLALRTRDRVRLWSRNGRELTGQYPEIAAAVARLQGGDLALDAEVVALDDTGRPSFHLLQRRMHLTHGIAAAAAAVPVTALVYDCLVLDGRDQRPLPLRARKALVRRLLPRGGVLRYCDHLAGRGQAFLAATCAAGLEGVVAKRADAPYCGGRRREWLKIKCHARQEFVIGGWTDPQGTRPCFGALHLGVYEDGALVYIGRVGSGFDVAGLRALQARLHALAAARCPFTRGPLPRGRGHHWVRPELVCEVRFTEWTPDGSIRHPIFLGLRPDRDPTRVGRERAAGATR